MRTNVPERLLVISEAVFAGQNVPVTKLTILKKWFAGRSTRLPAVAVWVAARAVSRKGKTKGEAAELFVEARDLLAGHDSLQPRLDAARAFLRFL